MHEHESSLTSPYERHEARPDRWTPQALSKLLFLSFRHSQGSPVLQNWLYKYVRAVSGQVPIPTSWDKGVKKTSRNAVYGYLQVPASGASLAPYHTSVNKQHVIKEVARVYRSMKSILSSHAMPQPYASVVYALTVELIQRDWQYVSGRRYPGRSARQRSSPQAYPFSYIQFYAIDGNSVGLPVFDQMYDEVHMFIRRSQAVLHPPTAHPSADVFLTQRDLETLEKIAARTSRYGLASGD